MNEKVVQQASSSTPRHATPSHGTGLASCCWTGGQHTSAADESVMNDATL